MGNGFRYGLWMLVVLGLVFVDRHVRCSEFEGFDTEEVYSEQQEDEDEDYGVMNPRGSTPKLTLTDLPIQDTIQNPKSPNLDSPFDFWDEDEFEGIPIQRHPHFDPSDLNPSNKNNKDGIGVPDDVNTDTNSNTNHNSNRESGNKYGASLLLGGGWGIEIVCLSFLLGFVVNYFSGKKENEAIALAWATKFATKDSIFDRNFSFLGVGKDDDSPLLLKEGQNIFKFYASGRRYCEGLLATMELRCRHDLISRLYNLVVPCRDEITFQVYMNEDSMDHVVFAITKKKATKLMHKELPDLHRFATSLSQPIHKKSFSDHLSILSESKEVASDLITDLVLDQVFGDKSFKTFGNGFISMHFSDQYLAAHRKMLVFKFCLPDANNMGDMTRLVALVPYYIDLIGRYKVSSQVRCKTEAVRSKIAQEAFKEIQNARQEALQKKKAEKRKMMEEAEAKLSAETFRKREAKERARLLKKAMPKMKLTRGH